MGKLSTASQLDELKTWEEAKRWVTMFCNDVKNQVNGKLSFSENLDVKIIECLFVTANVAQGFQHGLKRVPLGFIVCDINLGAVIYRTSTTTADTIDLIYLMSNTSATTAKIIVF